MIVLAVQFVDGELVCLAFGGSHLSLFFFYFPKMP